MAQAPTFRCSCGEKEGDATVIVCYGTTHKRPRAVHAECFGEDDDVSAGWLCDACTEDSQEASSQPQQSSQASTQLEYEVRQVLDEQVNPWTGETWFKVRWKSHPNRRYGDSWEPESNCAESADLIRKFRNGEPPSDPGSDRDRDAETPEQALEADEKSSGRYHPALLRGYWSLLRESTDEALAHPTLRGVSSAAYRSIGTEILSAMHWKILCGLTGAGLQRRKAGDPELSMLLDGLMDASVKRPNVYELELVDEDGHPPLVKEMRLFIERARLYANVNDSRSSKFAMKVEAVSSSSGLDSSEEKAIRNGDRKYLATAKARDNLEILLAQLESEIEDLDDDDRMPFALREIGYSDDGRRRIEEQHLKHRSANMLMTLFEAISCADEELDGTYRLEGQVIFLCLDQKHAALGEILLSCIGQAYVQTGRGFNGTHAGKSVASSKKYGDEWVDWQQEAVDEGLIASNLAAEKARIAAYRDRQQSLIAEIEAGNEEGTKFVLGDLVLARQIGDLYGSLEQQLANLQI